MTWLARTYVVDVARDAPAIRDGLSGRFQRDASPNGVGARTLAKFHGPSSPQLHIEYRMGRPVAFRARDIVLKRWNESCGVPERPWL